MERWVSWSCSTVSWKLELLRALGWDPESSWVGKGVAIRGEVKVFLGQKWAQGPGHCLRVQTKNPVQFWRSLPGPHRTRPLSSPHSFLVSTCERYQASLSQDSALFTPHCQILSIPRTSESIPSLHSHHPRLGSRTSPPDNCSGLTGLPRPLLPRQPPSPKQPLLLIFFTRPPIHNTDQVGT